MKACRRVVLFTRFPEAGRVKTRLIPELGPAGAAALHRHLVLRTLRTARAATQACRAELELRFDGGSEEGFHHWLGDDLVCRPQAGRDLGERMRQGFADSFREGSAATLIVGSDCPGLTPELLVAAFDRLGQDPVVLGPAIDGGYYLIGLARPLPELFHGISWGTQRVLAQSVAILERLGVEPGRLPPLDDIDRPADLPVWRRLVEPDDSGAARITVIIPVLNEAAGIIRTLESVRAGNPHEVIVVDGGSTHETRRLAANSGAIVITSRPGRARQMNAGAARARGNLLVFLHGDTVLPSNWAQGVVETLACPTVALGAFGFQLAEPLPGKWFVERTTNWRARRRGLPYGDQALFLRCATFEEEGGFAALPIMEDYEFVRRLRRSGQVIIRPEQVVTSGRRWTELGVLRTTLRNQLMVIGYHLGVSPAKLARFYAPK